MRKRWIVLGSMAALTGAWWFAAAPAPHDKIRWGAPPIGPAPQAVLDVRLPGDPIKDLAETIAPELPGYDEVVPQESLDRVFVTAMDGWIWKVTLSTGKAERFVDPPLMAAGARQMPGDPDTILFCASYLYGQNYPEGEKPGLYRLTVSTKTIAPVALRTPSAPAFDPSKEKVYANAETPALTPDQMQGAGGRDIAFCNDLDISADGERAYFSEPYPHPGASMGGGAFAQAVTRATDGRLWEVAVKTGAVRLAAQGFSFIDGVLIEPAANGGPEASVLITETVNFRIVRLLVSGPRAGQHEVLYADLPGLPDGLDRDAQGRVWVGYVKPRTAANTWLHNNPWTKPVLLRLPHALLPVPHGSGVLLLSPDAAAPLKWWEHDGSRAPDISVAVPGQDRVYLAKFAPDAKGLTWIPMP
jgi:sugar lactone lactonase YvrE